MASEVHFSQMLSEEMEWILGNDHLHEHLYRSLIEEVHAVAAEHITQELEAQIVEPIHNFTHKLSLTMSTSPLNQRKSCTTARPSSPTTGTASRI